MSRTVPATDVRTLRFWPPSTRSRDALVTICCVSRSVRRATVRRDGLSLLDSWVTEPLRTEVPARLTRAIGHLVRLVLRVTGPRLLCPFQQLDVSPSPFRGR